MGFSTTFELKFSPNAYSTTLVSAQNYHRRKCLIIDYLSLVPRLSHTSLVWCPYGIVIWAPDKTSARESGDEARLSVAIIFCKSRPCLYTGNACVLCNSNTTDTVSPGVSLRKFP